jgi:hypothetical protein
MQGMAQFSAGDLRVLDQTDEIDIETPRASGRDRRTIIWIVTVGGHAYIRSVRGPSGRWYQAVADGGQARLVAGSQSWQVRTTPVTDQAEIDQVSQAISRKYQDRWPGPTAAMLRPEVLPTTLRVEPA